MTALIQQVERTDAALFIFAKDDEVAIRGEPGRSARGNVLLEYGLFVARLGRERVLILEEEGVNLPSDVFGITTASFPAEPGVARNAALAVFVEEDVLPKWRGLRPHFPSGDDVMDTNLGYVKTIRQERQKLDEIVGALNKFSSSLTSTTRSPIQFGSTVAPISTYAEALGRVEKRFWTTTFLSSGFWTRPHGRVLAANEEMLKRIKESGGQVKRDACSSSTNHLILLCRRTETIASSSDNYRNMKSWEYFRMNMNIWTSARAPAVILFNCVPG